MYLYKWLSSTKHSIEEGATGEEQQPGDQVQYQQEQIILLFQQHITL